MEKTAELLPSTTPFQAILSYLKRSGEKELKSIRYGKRSGKKSSESGVILAYKEKEKDDSMHFLYFNYQSKRFDHVDDISWIFRVLQCDEEEPVVVPLEGYELFRQLKIIDEKAREEILVAINAPFEARKAEKIKVKNQERIYLLLYEMFKTAKAPGDDIKMLYQILTRENYAAWDNDFKKIYETYQENQDVKNFITSLNRLLEEYKIKTRQNVILKEVKPENLEMVGCMFLVNPEFKEWGVLG